MKTGIVMEIENRKAIIMKNNGEFVTIRAKKEWKTGEIVQIEEKKTTVSMWKIAAACLFFLFTFSGYGGYQIYFSRVSVMSIDVNPSIELTLNRFDKVISFQGMNPEGEEILQQINIKNLGYKEAILEILNRQEAEGYFEENEDMTITVYSNNKEKETVLLEEVQTITNQELSHYSSVKIECHMVEEELVKEAHKYGVTAGKYFYLKRLKELLPDIEIKEYCHHSIQQLKEEINICETKHQEKNTGNKDEDHHHHD